MSTLHFEFEKKFRNLFRRQWQYKSVSWKPRTGYKSVHRKPRMGYKLVFRKISKSLSRKSRIGFKSMSRKPKIVFNVCSLCSHVVIFYVVCGLMLSAFWNWRGHITIEARQSRLIFCSPSPDEVFRIILEYELKCRLIKYSNIPRKDIVMSIQRTFPISGRNPIHPEWTFV